ncbi:hypothetical protein [Methylobacterium iners]|uniref:Uncharacterized protein n=1 Tax=Methylobacterium iners TaxID=418707 RepID=A0ABQ4S6D4_9HYPH|nr:hypothetical protein [Methylobacterium iners]GJD98044.1 hypothetical protein OCOJLMKI_5283 [Methylobacterium iners]
MLLKPIGNVAPLLRGPASDRLLVQSQSDCPAGDVARLKELALQLKAAQRLFVRTADDLKALCSLEQHTRVTEVTDNYLKQVDALRSRMSTLINCSETHPFSV